MIRLTVYCYCGEGYTCHNIEAKDVAEADLMAQRIIRNGLRCTEYNARIYVPWQHILSVTFVLPPKEVTKKEAEP